MYQTKTVGEKTFYILPKPKNEKALTNGIFIILFGVLIAGGMAAWMASALNSGSFEEGYSWITWIFVAVAVPPFLFGVILILLGIIAAFNIVHSEVVIDKKMLAVTEGVSFIKRTQRRALSSITEIEVFDAPTEAVKHDRSEQRYVAMDFKGKTIKRLSLPGIHAAETLKLLAEALKADIESRLEDSTIEITETRKVQ